MSLFPNTQNPPQNQNDHFQNPGKLYPYGQASGLPSSVTPSYSHINLPGLKGIACQGRWQPIQAHEFAQTHGLSHFYVDGAKGASSPETIQSVINLTAQTSRLPIYHSNYHQPIASPKPELRLRAKEALTAEIALAARIHAPLILHGTSSPFLHKDIPDHQESLTAFDAELSELEKYANQLGVQLWIENLPANEAAVFNCLEDFEYILARHPEVRFVLDIGHANIANNDPFEALRQFPDKVVALSLSDNNGKVDLHQPLCQGSIPFGILLDLIESTKWQGLYIFETMGSHLDHDLESLSSILSKGGKRQ